MRGKIRSSILSLGLFILLFSAMPVNAEELEISAKSTPITIYSGETYEFINPYYSANIIKVEQGSANSKFDYIQRNSSMRTGYEVGKFNDFEIYGKNTGKITVTSGSINVYFPEAYKTSIKKSSTPVYHKNIAKRGTTYKYTNNSGSQSGVFTDNYNVYYEYVIYNSKGELYSSGGDNGSIFVLDGQTLHLNVLGDEGLELSVPYETKGGVFAGYTDIYNHFGRKEIQWFADKKYLDVTQSTFRPQDAITRAEFIKIVNNAMGYTSKAPSEKFDDVKSSDWWYSEVLKAIKAGYISSDNKNFRPAAPITREEVANIITTITKSKDRNLDKLNTYNDKHLVSDSMKSSVEGAIEKGYMGKGSKNFNPKKNITRGEAIVTLYRVIN